MKNIIVKSVNENILYINDKSYQIDKFSDIKLSIENNEEMIVNVYPINNNSEEVYIPYLLKINYDNGKLTFNKNNVKILSFKTYDELTLLPQAIFRSQSVEINKKEVTIDKLTYEIDVFKNPFAITIKQNENFFRYEFEGSKNKNYEIFKLNNNLAIIDEKNTKIIIFSTKNNNFKEINGNKLEINNEFIKSFTKLNTISKHARLIKYSSTSLEKLEDDLIYINGQPKNITDKSLIGYSFLESINVGDYNLARSYLCFNLKEKLTNTHLCNFAPKFDYISMEKTPSGLYYHLIKNDELVATMKISFNQENEIIEIED